MGRLLLLAAIIVGTGIAAGYAMAYPIRHLMPSGVVPVDIDQNALFGSFDADQALVQQADLDTTWQQGDPKVSQLVSLITTSYCGQKVEPSTRLGAALSRNFVDTNNSAVIFSEALPMTNVIDARNYLGRIRTALGSCKSSRFFQVDGGNRTEFEVRDDRRSPPVSEDSYISRTLQPVGGGTTRVVTYMQVGSVIIALEYQGRPHQISDRMDKIEKSMLERLVPTQFAKRADVPGVQPLPSDDASTTSVLDQTKPSPTSTPNPSPTNATTVPIPTTTVKHKPKPKTTTTVAATPTTAAPAH